MLPQKPETYTCGRCTATPPEKREANKERGRRLAEMNKKRKKA